MRSLVIFRTMNLKNKKIQGLLVALLLAIVADLMYFAPSHSQTSYYLYIMFAGMAIVALYVTWKK